jgi:hypothetical protein
MARKNVVVIYDMKPYNDATPFAKNNIVAVIPDARDVGVQLYANDSGYAYFTLPVDHPAIPLIQPLQQHYSVQKWDGSAYVDIQSGIITDYDAGSNEVVVNGVDYMTALNKYYTPIHGPELGDKAIPNNDTTTIASTTPKAIIATASSRDTGKKSEGYWVPVVDSTYPNVGKVEIYSGAPDNVTPGTAGSTWGTKDKLTITYEEVSGEKTGAVILSGCQYVWRDVSTAYWQDGETGKTIEGNFSIGTSSTSKGRIGFLLYANPGGPLLYFYEEYYYGVSTIEIGGLYAGLNAPLDFSIKLRPVSHYDAATEDHTGRTRTMSILTEGVSYEFYAIPFYWGNISPKDGSTDYNQYIWGNTTGDLDSSFTAGLQSDTLDGAITSALSTATDPMYVLDRTADYPDTVLNVTSCYQNNYLTTVAPSGLSRYWRVFSMAGAVPLNVVPGNTVAIAGVSEAYFNGTAYITEISTDRYTIYFSETAQPTTSRTGTGGTITKDNPVLVPIVKFASLNQVNAASSTTKHPFTTAGQGPVDFIRELSDNEMGTRVDGSKVIFNYYGVPGATADGTSLIVNHSVSSSAQATLIYPGQIKEFNVVSKLSMKTNSVRVIPTTDFLIGSSTEGASGVKSKGIVKVSSYSATDPALPVVQTQAGFLSSQSAGNFAQGVINNYGSDADVQGISVSLRTEEYGPIGMTGTPKLGETVRVVIRRKGVAVGSDEVSGLYNVGGMQWHLRTDGHEELMLDLVKPDRFKGPGVTWESKATPSPTPTEPPTPSRAPAPAPGPAPKPKTVPVYQRSGVAAPGTPRIAGRPERFQL